MKIGNTKLDGVYIIENFHAIDERGSFTKTYNIDTFKKYQLSTDFKESYFSVSKKNVIRGMHFQLPPYEHDKLVYVASGSIIDVVLDIRKNSDTYGEYIKVELSDDNHCSVFIQKGFAHGFIAQCNDTVTVYNVSTVYKPKSDCGIRYNSFGCEWNTDNPIISERDISFNGFNEFDKINPFK